METLTIRPPKGVFISNEAVLQDAREFIQKTAI